MRTTLERAVVCASLVFLTMAFGGVYSWAFIPALSASALAGISRAARNRRHLFPRRDRWIIFTGAAFIVLVMFQTIPLPPSALKALSPNLADAVSRFDLRYAIESRMLPISLSPALTGRAIFCAVALLLILIGFSAEITEADMRWLRRSTLALAIFISFAGFIQKASGTKLIYGFWRPFGELRAFSIEGSPFGPFINRNHFAGWMLLAVPIMWSGVASATRHMRSMPSRRERLVAWTGARGAEALLMLFGITISLLATIVSGSRSGIGAMVVVIGLMFSISENAMASLRAFIRLAVAIGVSVGLFLAVAPQAITARFLRSSTDINVRLRAWSDAERIVRDFIVLGTGLNTYSVATVLYEPPGLPVHYAQAHNDYLQLLAETGIVGFVTFVIFAAAVVFQMRRRIAESSTQSRSNRLLIACGLIGIALQEAVDFSLQMPANALLMVITVALILRPVQSATPGVFAQTN